MPGRGYTSGSNSYRFGMNGQEKTKELGENFYEALHWEYDARTARRWNVDPRPTVGVSSYATFNNNPIFHIDVLGDSSTPSSTQAQALAYTNSVSLNQNAAWKKIDPAKFMANIVANINNADILNQGSESSPGADNGTNFCGFAAACNFWIKNDPKGYAQFMVNLYNNGSATYNGVTITPEQSIMDNAGGLPQGTKYPGAIRPLSENHADQAMFLSLAGHYKSYVNTGTGGVSTWR